VCPSNKNKFKEAQFFVKYEIEMAKTHKFTASNVVPSKFALQSEWMIPDAMYLRIIK
jgi:hypothetical protein